MFAGLAAATKYNGVAMLAPVGWAIVERRVRRTEPRVSVLALGSCALAGFVGAVVVACPPCVLEADRTLAAMRYLYSLSVAAGYAGWGNSFIAPTVGWWGRPYLYQLVASLPYALGWPLYALALGGVGVALWQRELPDRLLLSALLPYGYVIGGSYLGFPRYLLPLFPCLAILAARALVRLVRSPIAQGMIFVGVWTYSLALTASQVARFSNDQQRGVAQWIATSLAADTSPERVRVGVPPPMGLQDFYRLARPLTQAGLVYLPVRQDAWLAERPEFFVLPEWFEIAIHRDFPRTYLAAQLDRLQSGAAGYRAVARWRSWYLQRELYTRLDPAFAGDLWQGSLGFTVYRRE
jgi:hypothetical protein